MAEQAERNTGWKILGGLLAFVLLIAWCSDPDPDEDAWSQGAPTDADDADFDVDDDSGTDPDFAWTEGDEDGPGPPPCDGVGWFSTEGGAVLLPVAGSGTELPTPSCQLGGTPDGDADAVELLQRVLACNGQPVTVDGAYGPQTAQAVSAVQDANDIAVDGVYGPQTNAVMAWPVGTASGEVVGEDPIADRPPCTADPVEPAPAPLPGTG